MCSELFFFRKARCCFATMFVLVSFSSFCFFWKEVFVIGISRASVWLFGFGVVYFFSEGEVLFCDVFLLLSFSSFCFFLGGVEDVFVIGISRVSVWPFGFGII